MIEFTEFNQRLIKDWLVPFCSARGYSLDGFDSRVAIYLSENDARDFMQSVDHGLVVHHGGFFTAPQSKAKEQIFWEGDRQSVPRKISLWLEPIITMGALRRLQQDYGWEGHLLGLQSKTWAFDLVAYSPMDINAEYLVCEVKKTAREIDLLINLMRKHLDSPAYIEQTLKGAERNAFKKVMALRASPSNVFWALGPNRYSYVFTISRGHKNSLQMLPADESVLHAPSHSSSGTR